MKTILIILTAITIASCDVPTTRPMDHMTVTAKYEYTSGTVRYCIRTVNDKTALGESNLYFYSSDRSFDVGDEVQLIKK